MRNKIHSQKYIHHQFLEMDSHTQNLKYKKREPFKDIENSFFNQKSIKQENPQRKMHIQFDNQLLKIKNHTCSPGFKQQRKNKEKSKYFIQGQNSIQLVSIIQKPSQQISNSNPQYTLQINEQALIFLTQKYKNQNIKDLNTSEKLSEQKQYSFCSIVGKAKTGKSFLCNQLLNLNQQNLNQSLLQSSCFGESKINRSTFSVNHTVTPCTKGIWLSKQTITFSSQKQVKQLFLIDTQGLGSYESIEQLDCKLMILSILVSDVLCYNSIGPIDQHMMSSLSFAIELAKLVNNEQNNQYSIRMPSLLWILRDFSLQLITKSKQSINDDQYLQKCLQETLQDKKNTKKNQSKNRMRECIKKIFPNRKCSALILPFGQNGQTRQQFKNNLIKLKQKMVDMTRYQNNSAYKANGTYKNNIQEFICKIKAFVQCLNNSNQTQGNKNRNFKVPKIFYLQVHLQKSQVVHSLKNITNYLNQMFQQIKKAVQCFNIQNQDNSIGQQIQNNLNKCLIDNKIMDQVIKIFKILKLSYIPEFFKTNSNLAGKFPNQFFKLKEYILLSAQKYFKVFQRLLNESTNSKNQLIGNLIFKQVKAIKKLIQENTQILIKELNQYSALNSQIQCTLTKKQLKKGRPSISVQINHFDISKKAQSEQFQYEQFLDHLIKTILNCSQVTQLQISYKKQLDNLSTLKYQLNSIQNNKNLQKVLNQMKKQLQIAYLKHKISLLQTESFNKLSKINYSQENQSFFTHPQNKYNAQQHHQFEQLSVSKISFKSNANFGRKSRKSTDKKRTSIDNQESKKFKELDSKASRKINALLDNNIQIPTKIDKKGYNQCFNCQKSFYNPYLIISASNLKVSIIRTMIKQKPSLPFQIQQNDFVQLKPKITESKIQYVIQVKLNHKKWYLKRKLKDFIELSHILTLMFYDSQQVKNLNFTFNSLQFTFQANKLNKFNRQAINQQNSCQNEHFKQKLDNFLHKLNQIQYVRNSRIFQKFIKINKEYLEF